MSQHDGKTANEITVLRAAVRQLSARLSELEAASVRATSSPGVPTPEIAPPAQRWNRRQLIGAGITGIVAAGATQLAFPGAAAADGSDGSPVTTDMYFGDTDIDTAQPLDAVINLRRRQTVDHGSGYVEALLALQQEGQSANSYPWTLFVKNTATTSTPATQTSANSYAVNSRLVNAGGGHGAAFFSDLQHGDATHSASTGESLGYDCEIIRNSPDGRVTGLNVANVGDPATAATAQATTIDADSGLNLQYTQYNGVRRGWNGDPARARDHRADAHDGRRPRHLDEGEVRHRPRHGGQQHQAEPGREDLLRRGRDPVPLAQPGQHPS